LTVDPSCAIYDCVTQQLIGLKVKTVRLAFAICVALSLVAPVTAEAKRASSTKGKGLYCHQGDQNIYIPAANLPAKYRSRLVKGQTAKVNLPGFGPVTCVVY
jgi:hypothetical protein